MIKKIKGLFNKPIEVHGGNGNKVVMVIHK
jgi:hypothetical protein